ncbi:3-oxoacyl-[acyl-carrier-protein] reductase FabG [Zhongshania aliphaticivorans]|uniref:3-oxoacyl-[acyl-carrier-protein] reductase FabG n=1 Tax=Zhongshania aliphaticivorans TaxID=1470434 RepID=A0A5S9Q0C1_9GAMM|nr:SDR family oxidoreductase [Zhongshania aliphaticivorans]CAA0092875.1 3-oxoacyl-[acyl-carrier-protein] reductase FabG [Zhongshania aliphaticivorans]CAA0110467.1 3-oxoacyl-[acyl-carrier-protein] reductase FabG [Zhongshania aliphaticivorans]
MNKVLILSGGSQGIGFATAKRFLAEGYTVLNLSRRAIELEGVQQVCIDMQERDWLDNCKDQLQACVKSADSVVLLHNAARHDSDSVRDLSAENFANVLQVNLVAPQQLNTLLLPHMKPGSAVLYMGSTLSEKAVAGCASYIASKHGVVGLMRATTQDLIGRGIHTACICPGFTDTAMLRGNLGDDPAVMSMVTGMVSYGRLIEPREIVDTLFFCAHNPVINGSVIHANLGQIER